MAPKVHDAVKSDVKSPPSILGGAMWRRDEHGRQSPLPP